MQATTTTTTTTINQNSPSQGSTTRDSTRIMQINVEGISKAKFEVLEILLLEQNVDILLIQETHKSDEEQLSKRGFINGYTVAGATYHSKYSTATYVRENLKWKFIQATDYNNIFIIQIEINNLSVFNIYKPPNISWTLPMTLNIQHPSVVMSDFNSHHTTWGYNDSDKNGEDLTQWSEAENLTLIYDSKSRGTFHSARWNRDYNPDLCFVSKDEEGNSLELHRNVLTDFPHSRHRPVVIEIGIDIHYINSIPKPRWNFQKANWPAFTKTLNDSVRWIPPTNENYHCFSKLIISTAKKFIPRGLGENGKYSANKENQVNPNLVANHIVNLSRATPDKQATKDIKSKLRNLKIVFNERTAQAAPFSIEEIRASQSSTKQLNNGLPEGSVLAPTLFNLYISDLPSTISRKFAYGDDITVATQHEKFENNEAILNQDLEKLRKYFKQWRLKPNIQKTEVSTFHLNNKLTKHQPTITFGNQILAYNPSPKYLGKLAGSTWGASTETLRTSALALVYSAAEYAAPVWLNSAHCSKIDVQLNSTMRVITSVVKTTPTQWLPVLCNIHPPHIRRFTATTREWSKYKCNEKLPINKDIPTNRTSRLKSRKPVCLIAKDLIENKFNGDNDWRSKWSLSNPDSHQLINDPCFQVPGFSLKRREWVTLNRLRTENFKETCQMVAKFDEIFANHFYSKTNYTSWSVQNTIIDVCAKKMNDFICNEIKECGVFSVMVDEAI
ncbi:hypothetical protein QTP88_007041 [Uroleucon formosanum]